MSGNNVGLVVDVKGVTNALSILNGGAPSCVPAGIDTLVVFSESQQAYFTLLLRPFGNWDPGALYQLDVNKIQLHVSLSKSYGGASDDVDARSVPASDPLSAGGAPPLAAPAEATDEDGIPTGRPLTPHEALAAYKKKYPKAKGMADTAILEYIAAITSMYKEKKSAGHLKVGKISTIQEACERSGLMSTNKMGQPSPFYQRGGRKNYRSRALEAIFHWVTGLSPKKKSGSSKNSRGDDASSASRAKKKAGQIAVPGMRSGAASISELRQYKFISQIGVGAFAVVYQAIHLPTGTRVAVKAMQKLSSNLSRLKAEINVLKTIQHPNVTALSEVIETESHVYLVLEYMGGGELFDAIVAHGGYTEAQAVAVTRNILSALVYLHSKGVIHRDLKPENLLLVDSSNLVDVKLTDFGMATILKDNCRLTFTKAGTLQYVAPEIICSDSGYSFAVDLWSLGIVVVCLLTGNAPFACRTPEEYRHAIESIASTNGSCLFGPQWSGISSDAQAFVHALLRVRPGDRPTALQALKHPWLADEASNAEGEASEAPSRTHMKRPLSSRMERSHTNELRHYSNQRKRGRIRSALYLQQQMAERPDSMEVFGKGMDDVPIFSDVDLAGQESISDFDLGDSSQGGAAGDRISDPFGGLNELEFGIESPTNAGSNRNSLLAGESPLDGPGPGDRLSQASLLSVWSGIDDDLAPAMQDILDGP